MIFLLIFIDTLCPPPPTPPPPLPISDVIVFLLPSPPSLHQTSHSLASLREDFIALQATHAAQTQALAAAAAETRAVTATVAQLRALQAPPSPDPERLTRAGQLENELAGLRTLVSAQTQKVPHIYHIFIPLHLGFNTLVSPPRPSYPLPDPRIPRTLALILSSHHTLVPRPSALIPSYLGPNILVPRP